MVASAVSVSASFSIGTHGRNSADLVYSHRNPCSIASSFPSPYGESSQIGFSSKTRGFRLKLDEKNIHDASASYGAIEAKKGNPPIMLAVITPGGLLDLLSVLFTGRIIFLGQPINPRVAQRLISPLVTLATVDEDAAILIKPKVGTVCFRVAASQGAFLLAGGEKGMCYAMPNTCIIMHQPQSGCGGHVEDVRRQVNEAVQSCHKIDRMYAAFTGQPLEKVQQYT